MPAKSFNGVDAKQTFEHTCWGPVEDKVGGCGGNCGQGEECLGEHVGFVRTREDEKMCLKGMEEPKDIIVDLNTAERLQQGGS
jgi:hypothetical protein